MDNRRMIMVIDESGDRADGLKELIEFMDAPYVTTATPENWQSRLGSERLAAIFVSDALRPAALTGLMDNIGRLDPNVPIVLVNNCTGTDGSSMSTKHA